MNFNMNMRKFLLTSAVALSAATAFAAENQKVWIDDVVIKKHGKPYEGPAHYPFRNEI